MNKNIAPWIMIWSLLMAILPLGFAIVGYTNPGFFGAGWAAKGVSALGGVMGLYIGRNMASALIMFFALAKRSAPMLIIALLMRIFSDVFDVIHKLIAGNGDMPFYIIAAVLICVSSFAVYRLWDAR